MSLILLYILLSESVIGVSVGKKIETTFAQCPEATVAIVLGAKVYSTNRMSGMLNDRVDAAISLYKIKKVKKILFSGDHGKVSYDEVNTMRHYAVKRGVPVEDIFTDHAGFDTYDSLYRARDVFLVKDALVVSQRFHLPRAVYIAQRLGLKATGIVADKQHYSGKILVWLGFREILACSKAFFEVNLLKPKPKFLGKIIPIIGSGLVSWDGK